MRVAVNAIFLQNNPLEGYGHYAYEVVKRWIANHPNDEFLLLTDRPSDPIFPNAPNVEQWVVSPAARHPLAFKYWYDIAAPMALRKWKPDVWFQPYGFCSLTTRIPQLLVVHDLAFLHHPQYISWHQRWYYRQFTPAFIRKAARVATVSAFSATDIASRYRIREEEIIVAPGAAREGFVPLDWEQKMAVKDGYADGREYFLFVGGIHPRKNLMNLLKGFSMFKKWQHSNMKLLVAGRLAWQYDDILEKLKTYKYRDDVVMLDYLTDQQLYKVMAGAYALVYPSWFEGFGLPIVEAMQSGVPVLASDTSSMPEVGGEAILTVPPGDPEAIGKHMLALYRNETLRDSLITKGFEQARNYDWDATAGKLWDNLKI